MTIEELRDKIRLHSLWLINDPSGSRADLSRANLSGADLYGANLSRANLYGANLSRADLYGADLSRADLSRANLSGANLSRANLSDANLSGANLSRADLYGANLYGANLSRANLYGANLYGADKEKIINDKSIVPQEGAFIAWKAARDIETGSVVILKLQIPASAMRLGGINGRKCRASEAKVISARTVDDKPLKQGTVICSDRTSEFIYQIGKMIKPDSFDNDAMKECSNGIHFFITRSEACEYLR